MTTEINTQEVYKAIKKQNGEQFAKLLRENFLLNIPNLQHILEFAGRNPTEAEELLLALRYIQTQDKAHKHKDGTLKTPFELLDEAGYDAFLVTSSDEQNSIKKYFRPGEELCTFWDKNRDRYKTHFIIHAVKRGIDKIKPSAKPEREDEYGHSVISIQIPKGGNFISIKNRYNHTVYDPDNTFNNNADNIILGLEASLRKYFNVDLYPYKEHIPDNYRKTDSGQLVRFNYKIGNNTYFGDKYYFISNSKPTKLNTDYEIMLDYVILDTKSNTVRSPLASKNENVDELVRVLNDEISGHTTKIVKDKTTQETVIKIVDANKQEQELVRTKNGCITGLNLYKTIKIGNNFLDRNTTLTNLCSTTLKSMGNHCFQRLYKLNKVKLSSLESMGDYCFCNNYQLAPTNWHALKLRDVGTGCFMENNTMKIYLLAHTNLFVKKLQNGDALYLAKNELDYIIQNHCKCREL